jgi:hypothetical protein
LKAATVAMKVPERHLQQYKPFPKAAVNSIKKLFSCLPQKLFTSAAFGKISRILEVLS